MSETAPWWVAGTAVAAWVLRETWGAVLARKKDRTETDANVTLVQGLTERIERLEKSQASLTAQIDEEIKQRQAAQEQAHGLRLRVMTLEAVIRGLGAVIPPEHT